jgi:alpha-aminoadipate/glutamate carrier protein LysW
MVRRWPLSSQAAWRYIITPQDAGPNPRGGSAVVRCPECATEIDVDEDEVEEGEILACPECETEMEVVQIHPVKVNAISDDEDEEEEEESEDGDDFDDDDDLEDEEET